MIILTSFLNISNSKDKNIYSIASKQPYDYGLANEKYDTLDVFVPDSSLLSLSCEEFYKKYWECLNNNKIVVNKVLCDLFFDDPGKEIIFCCWCNSKMHFFDNFFCHRITLKDYIDKFFPYIKTKLII